MIKNPPGKLLIILLGAIGDVLRAIPLAVRIKNSWPETQIHWAIEPKSFELIKDHSCIDKIIVFRRQYLVNSQKGAVSFFDRLRCVGKGLMYYAQFLSNLRKENYDIVLDLQRHFKSGFTSLATGSKTRVGFSRHNAKECNFIFNNKHIQNVTNFSLKIHHYQKFGDLLGLPPLDPLDFRLSSSMKLSPPLVDLVENCECDQLKKKEYRFFAVIPGSTWPSRFWIQDYYAKLILSIYERWGLFPVFVGANAEIEFVANLLLAIGRIPYVNLVGRMSLADLKSVFSSVDFAVSSDSGPMHIAAAVGTPVVSIWGSTSPKRSAPYGSESFVIQSSMSCSPCYKSNCPGLGQICMKEITPEMVMRKIEIVLSIKSQVIVGQILN